MATLISKNLKFEFAASAVAIATSGGERIIISTKKEMRAAAKWLERNGPCHLGFGPETEPEKYRFFYIMEDASEKVMAICLHN